MKAYVFLAFSGLLLAQAVGAGVTIVPRDGDAPATAAPGVASHAVLPKVDAPSDLFVLPFFEVDTSSPDGRTTFYAVRNTSDDFIDLRIDYLAVDAQVMHQETPTLGPQETLSINLRDVPGLAADALGIRRGFALIEVTNAPTLDNLTGDFLRVDFAQDFATGERLVTAADLCDVHEVRFLDFGSGTRLMLFVNNPQGNDINTDPPSVSGTVYDEQGTMVGAFDVYTDLVVVDLDLSIATPRRFGTVVLEFLQSGGWVYAEYSAFGRFSVGVGSACR